MELVELVEKVDVVVGVDTTSGGTDPLARPPLRPDRPSTQAHRVAQWGTKCQPETNHKLAGWHTGCEVPVTNQSQAHKMAHWVLNANHKPMTG